MINLSDNESGSYINKKAKNLATKEDVGAITHEVENVKLEYDKKLEEYKTVQALRMAAFDQRLRAHQEAHALWFRLRESVHNDKCGKVVTECQTWWINNSLYLEPEAREAFNKAYMAAHIHSEFARDRKNPDLAKKNWNDIERAGTIIPKCVGLEPIAAEKPEPPKESNRCQRGGVSGFGGEYQIWQRRDGGRALDVEPMTEVIEE